jgi:hypothetical protein
MKQTNNTNIVSVVNSTGQVNDSLNVFMRAVEIDYENIKLADNTGMAIELISPTIDILHSVPYQKIISQQEEI